MHCEAGHVHGEMKGRYMGDIGEVKCTAKRGTYLGRCREGIGLAGVNVGLRLRVRVRVGARVRVRVRWGAYGWKRSGR